MLGNLVPVGEGDPIPLLKPYLRVGRRSPCDIILSDPKVSSRHAELRVIDGYWWVFDKRSKNGVWVNGKSVAKRKLQPGDILVFGRQEYAIEYPGQEETDDEGELSSKLAGFLEVIEAGKAGGGTEGHRAAAAGQQGTMATRAHAHRERGENTLTIGATIGVGALVLLALVVWAFRSSGKPDKTAAGTVVRPQAEQPAQPAATTKKSLPSRKPAQGIKADADSVVLGPWYTTGPLESKGFRDALFPENGVDLKENGPDAKPLWREVTEWSDGTPAVLPGGDRVSTYLFRTITAQKPTNLPAGFGSDGGLVVWLNDAPLIFENVGGGTGKAQHVDLELEAGRNALLLKIYHGGGSDKFFFLADLERARLRKRGSEEGPTEGEDTRIAKRQKPDKKPTAGPREKPGPKPARTGIASVTPKKPPTVEPSTPKSDLVPAPPPRSKGLAVPSRKAQDEMARQFDEVYKFSEHRTPAQMVALSTRLLNLGQKSQGGPVEKFTYFRKAAELARRGGDPALMLQVVDAIAGEFDVDVLQVKEKLLAAFAAESHGTGRIKSFFAFADLLVDEALAEGRYDVAASLVETAYDTSQKAGGKEFRKQAYQRQKEVLKLAESWDKLQDVRIALKKDPADPQANLAMGRWLCFVRGDWEAGLPHLSKCGNPVLQRPATQELTFPPGKPREQVRLADAWWALAEQAPATEKNALMLHAGDWYERAKPDLPEGFDRDKVAKRLAEIVHITAPAGSPAGAVPPEKKATPSGTVGTRKEITLDLGGGVQMEFVLIPAGTLMMGDAEGKDHEKPVHKVTITRPFYLGKYEVTQQQWQALMGDNPSKFKGPDNPVDFVSWEACQEFIEKLDEKFARRGAKFSLPTEAQWEHACRAGTTTRWSFGDDGAMIEDFAWLSDNAAGKTHPVGGKKPNAWGLYDMHGNVVEWCADFYGKDYYRKSAVVDPPGPAQSDWRVVRGGSFNNSANGQRSAWRGTGWPAERFNDFGFRVARSATGAAGKP